MPEEDPGTERSLRRGSEHVGGEHDVAAAESVTRHAPDEQEGDERNCLGC